MDKFYQKFQRLGVSLAPLGIETREDNTAYFCTPKGASIIGWAGADGIHYCRVRGFGDMIFAVSPMNGAQDYARPIAENFEIFLRLLLACGDATVLEQAWQWSEERFSTFLAENPPAGEIEALLSEIGGKLDLSPMENPWRYLHSLRENFDYSKIRYTEDVNDPDMNPEARPAPPEWKVYFNGSFWGHQGNDRAGAEIHIGKEFDWADHHWLIPAAYSCGKGLVVDFCMRVEPEKIRSFMEKWNLNGENDTCEQFTQEQRMKLDLDNPLRLRFTPSLELNGQKLQTTHGITITFNPCLPDGDISEAVKYAMEHYKLDNACGWVISRSKFPWARNSRPEIRTLSLTMEEQPARVPGPHFKVRAIGDSFSFVHPVSRTEYTLVARKLERQTLDMKAIPSSRWKFPEHFTVMCYTLSPETSASIAVSDCEDGDRPIEIAPPDDPSTAAASIGIIGGADGPTALVFGDDSQGKLRTACSAPRFEPADDIEWRITFDEKRFDSCSVTLKEQ